MARRAKESNVKVPTAYWSIDSALGLQAVDSQPAGASRLHRLEQFIDTIVLRNLDTMSQFYFGHIGRFLFHSIPRDAKDSWPDGAKNAHAE